MKRKVAVFIREGMEMENRLQMLAKEQKKLELYPFIYKKTEQVIELIERAFICDIYMFTEPLAYLYVKNKIKKKRVPSFKVHVDEYMVYRALCKLENDDKQYPDRLSIDLPDRQPLDMILKDWQGSLPEIHVHEYKDDEEATVENIARYHEQLWQEDKIDHVLTSSIDIKNRLQEAAIPATAMEVTYSNLVACLDETKSLITLRENDSSLVVVSHVTVKSGHVADEKILQQMKLILTKFAQHTDSSLVETVDNRFTLFGTKALLEHIKDNYGTFPLLNKMKSEVSIPVNIAFGLGLKANEANHHANIALDKCQTEEESISYVVNEREDTIGPLGVKKHIDTSKLYQALIHKARLNNELSYNFINFIKDRNNEPFSSHDVAAFYNVTKRSAERTVNKLLSGEVIKVSGEERPYEKGRPRKLFTLNI